MCVTLSGGNDDRQISCPPGTVEVPIECAACDTELEWFEWIAIIAAAIAILAFLRSSRS